jgi:hypothetical protein
MEIRDSKDIITALKELVNSKEYLYTLCLIDLFGNNIFAKKNAISRRTGTTEHNRGQ